MNPDELPPGPPAPLPATGEPGAEGEQGTVSHGGTGGHGGAGGRGGIGLTGPRGFRGGRGETGGEQGEQGEKGDAGAPGDLQSTFDKYALAVAVLVTALSAIYFSVVTQQRLDDGAKARGDIAAAQAVYADQVACQQSLIADTVSALRARSAFAEQQAQVTVRVYRDQLLLVKLLEDPNLDPTVALAARQEYATSLKFGIIATRDQLTVRSAHPYPSLVGVGKCR